MFSSSLGYNRDSLPRDLPVPRSLGLEHLEHRPYRTIAVIGAAFAVAYLAAMTMFPRAHGRIIDGDGIQYYAYLRSLVFDGDVNFINDYQLLYGDDEASVWTSARTVTGHAVNLMSIGPALLWLPAFLLVCAVAWVGNLVGAPIALDGISAPFQVSVGLAGIAYATAGICLCYRICARLFAPAPAFWASLVAWLASPAIYYSLGAPAYSHAVSLFAVALFVDIWLRTQGNLRPMRYVLLGALAGLVALVRWQDAIIVLLPLSESIAGIAARTTTLTLAVRRLGLMAGGSVVAFMPQMLAWRAMYGRLILTPQGSDFMQWTDPQVVAVLFSWNHGLFSWTPAVLVAACGLPWLHGRDRLLGWSSVLVLLTAVYINASVVDWWAGEAFGARRFISYTVLFALALTALASAPDWIRARAWIRIAAVFLIVSNVLFMAQYQLFMRGYRDIAAYPTTATQVLLERFLVPWRLATGLGRN